MISKDRMSLLKCIYQSTYNNEIKWQECTTSTHKQHNIISYYKSDEIFEVTYDSISVKISTAMYIYVENKKEYIHIDINVDPTDYIADSSIYSLDTFTDISYDAQELYRFVFYVINHAIRLKEEKEEESGITQEEINKDLENLIEKRKEDEQKKKGVKKMLFGRNQEKDSNIEDVGKSFFKVGSGFAVIILIVILLASSFTIIDTGERGVVLRLGEFKYVMSEGINFKLPFIDKVITMSIRDVTYNSKAEVSSKDMQTIQVDTTLIYSLDPNKLGDVYKTYGINIQNVVIKPTMAEVVNAVVAEYNIESFVEKRAEISKRISDAFVLKIQNTGINVKSLLITNHDFSDEYDKAIEAKKVAEQGALKAKYDLEKTRLDAEAQTLKQKSLNEMVLQEKAIDKWDGHLPTYMGDGRNLPFLIKR